MKKEYFAYFKIDGMSTDIEGNLYPVYAMMSVGTSEKDVPYEVIVEAINIEALAKMLNVKPEAITILTKEEYERESGDDT